MSKHICNLCCQEFEDEDILNQYCPACKEKFSGTYMMERYKLKVVITELKIEIKKALKESFIGRLLLKLL